MAKTALRGNPIDTSGELPEEGSEAPGFELVKPDLTTLSSRDLAGTRTILNIFPSVDTPVCAQSVRTFNEQAATVANTTVVCVSADLPFALGRFCGAEGIQNVTVASAFRSTFLDDYGVKMTEGPLAGLAARAVVVLDGDGTVLHTELVPEIGQEPDYDAAIAALD